ncbi:pantoate--beta-alanine ligase [Methylovirgula ligni]|uniref:Pantothenate synthetase n=1 Tax=Methylovirgula ligni TaxID=569860 RepID=A0A3D9YYF6_9HYPH|nr:pantoate--beta-alanine ligase [Methylovirgula ligni]QAY96358.1 pantoate--beta-alanine ligase [Methylovirgula ligni]REF85922.1 pantothenate synthetase [Methylovirgula ligni]
MGIEIARDVAALRRTVARWRAEGARIALVPTMGALHEGHLSLVQEAGARADRIIMSIFVNPTQFAPTEDFAAYPRSFDKDVAAFAAAGGDLVFAPEVAEVYPPGFVTKVSLGGPATAGLEDKFRPDHFAGVATIVAKLLIMAAPDVAIFGEKDYQQLAVIRRMARDLNLEAEIVGAPTIRAADGLALSSRNVYLGLNERGAAPLLHAALERCRAAILRGVPVASAVDSARDALTEAGFAVDYVAARHAETLAPVAARGESPIRLLVAARIGTTRLIDNIGV